MAPDGGAGGCGCLDVEESLDLTLGVLHTQTLQGLGMRARRGESLLVDTTPTLSIEIEVYLITKTVYSEYRKCVPYLLEEKNVGT